MLNFVLLQPYDSFEKHINNFEINQPTFIYKKFVKIYLPLHLLKEMRNYIYSKRAMFATASVERDEE